VFRLGSGRHGTSSGWSHRQSEGSNRIAPGSPNFTEVSLAPPKKEVVAETSTSPSLNEHIGAHLPRISYVPFRGQLASQT